MNYESARAYLVSQSLGIVGDGKDAESTFMQRLKQGIPPLPGQATTILLALRVVFDHVQGQEFLDRQLVHALHVLATQGPWVVSQWRSMGRMCPPLLEDDLQRIAMNVDNIFSGVWKV